MLAIFGFIDIVRTAAILAFAALCGWVIYKAMKGADADEENEDNEKRSN